MQPLFSIITVTYNAAQWLERTMESIISQNCQDVEYIVIDGGSTDGTLDIIKRYENHITYWISEPDKGIYDAMNKGMKVATGDYLWFLNAGDTFYSPNVLLEMSEAIQANQFPDIIYGETEIMDAQGNNLGNRRLKAPDRLTWKSFSMGMLVCHQSFVVKRTMADDYDLQYRFSADYDWTIRCMRKASTIYNSHLVLSRFLEAGASTVNRKVSLKERFRIMSGYYGFFPTALRHIWFAIRYYFAKLVKGRVE